MARILIDVLQMKGEHKHFEEQNKPRRDDNPEHGIITKDTNPSRTHNKTGLHYLGTKHY